MQERQASSSARSTSPTIESTEPDRTAASMPLVEPPRPARATVDVNSTLAISSFERMLVASLRVLARVVLATVVGHQGQEEVLVRGQLERRIRAVVAVVGAHLGRVLRQHGARTERAIVHVDV